MATDETTGSRNTKTEAARHPVGLTRPKLLWAMLVFQAKLVIDGLRDVVLSPLTLVAGIWGLLEGGDHPERHLNDVINFGRRTERWINLFGRHREGTADEWVAPLEQRFYEELERHQRASEPRPGETGRSENREEP